MPKTIVINDRTVRMLEFLREYLNGSYVLDEYLIQEGLENTIALGDLDQEFEMFEEMLAKPS